MSSDIETTITYGDDEVDITVEYSVTYWGSPGCGPSLTYPGDPPEPPEFEINKIYFMQDGAKCEIEWDNIPEKMQERIDECIYEAIAEADVEPDYPEPDYD